MKTSNKGLKFLTKVEGLRLQVYKDVAGYPTIGVGHLLVDGEDFSGGITNKQAMDLLRVDVEFAEDAVNRYVSRPALLNMLQYEFDALVSFVFNVGAGAFKASTLLKRLNNMQYDSIPAQLRRWNKAGGKVRKGLIKRRNKEINLFLTGKY